MFSFVFKVGQRGTWKDIAMTAYCLCSPQSQEMKSENLNRVESIEILVQLPHFLLFFF